MNLINENCYFCTCEEDEESFDNMCLDCYEEFELWLEEKEKNESLVF